MTPVLEIDGVTRRWRKRPAPVLDDVSLTLGEGDVVWIGGANGAGKTTLLRIATGLLSPDSGNVRVLGQTLEEDRARYYRALGFLSAGDRGLVARMTVRAHLRYWCRLALMSPASIQPAIDASIALLGIEELVDRRVDRLSQGQRQRVRIAMSYLHEPQLLILDEPRNSLDDAGYEALGRVVTHATDRGGAVLWCSPRGEDRVLDFTHGYQLRSGKLEEVSS